MPDHRRIWPIIRRIWITLGLIVTAIFVTWSLLAYRSNDAAREAAAAGGDVDVAEANGIWRFTPTSVRSGAPTLVFFPGALVDPRAYAPLARAVAEAGFPVVLVELPRRGAFGGAKSPDLEYRIDEAMPAEPGAVVVGGHSRGAVVASRIAATQPDRIAGLVIIGSSHPRDHDLSSLKVPVTKIVGTRDGLASPTEVRGNARLLPEHTTWMWIEGGNHSQFGWYGFQPLDRTAKIDAPAQQAAMIEAVLELMASVDTAPQT